MHSLLKGMSISSLIKKCYNKKSMTQTRQIKQGIFIAIEGGEGSGKSKFMEYLRQKLADRTDVIFTREPGGTEISEKIRTILKDPNNGQMSAIAELLLFCAARAQHMEEVIIPALENGKIVITDRFDGSTMAYQIFGRQRQHLVAELGQINAIATQNIKPDLVVYLDLDPKIGLARVAKDKNRNGIDRLDAEKLEFHQRVRDGYLSQLKNNENWVKVDAEQSEEKVKEDGWQIIKNKFKI